MSVTPRNLPLRIHAPILPDNHVCDAVYGQNIIPSVCRHLVNTYLPYGSLPVHIYTQDPSPSNALRVPYTVRGPGCVLSIESAGPMVGEPNYVKVAPMKLRGLAAFVIEKCPVEQNGHGGFVTLGMGHATAFIAGWGFGMDSTDQNHTGEFPLLQALKCLLVYVSSKRARV